jgi:5'-3' exonuclease
LTFTSPVLLRHLTFAEARKMPISEISFDKVLEGLKLNINEFVDLCILLGCDYCDTIKGIGPKRAWELIEQYRSIEKDHREPRFDQASAARAVSVSGRARALPQAGRRRHERS